MLDFIQNNGKDFLIFLIIFWTIIREISHKWDKKELEGKLKDAEYRVEKIKKAYDAISKLYYKQSKEFGWLTEDNKALIAELEAKKEIIEDFPERDPKTGRFVKRSE